MLILQRKKDESLLINGNIKISILEINSDRVKIAIDAPKTIPIMRSELIDAAATNKEASTITEASITTLKNIINNKQ